MYSQFFGFDKLPFRLRPDPDFLYSGREYLRARASLIAALRGGSRIVLFMGPPGVGKTLLLDDVLQKVDDQFALCRINQPHISATELLQALLLQLGVPVAEGEPNRPQLMKELSAALESASKDDAPALLIIDDAQMLADSTLLAFPEILARARRLKILLVARQDPRQRGDDLQSRLNVVEKPHSIYLDALTADGVRAYIDHRLRLAGGGGKDLFTADAFSVIYQHTAGSPRLINVLCDAALHAACLRASGHVSGSEIVLASQDPRWPEALARDQAAIDIDEGITADSVVAGAPIEFPRPPSVPETLPEKQPAAVAATESAEPPSAAAPQAHAPAAAVPIPPVADARTELPAAQAPPALAQAPVAQAPAAGAVTEAPLADGPSGELPTASARHRTAQHSPVATSAQFIISHRKTHIRAWPLHAGRISIGRAADNQLRIEAPYISRHHCEVVTAADVSVIEDLGSVNGITVNGKVVKRHVLKHADVVTLGEHVLRYVVS